MDSERNEVDDMDNSKLIARLESASNMTGRDSDSEVMQDAIERIREMEAEIKKLRKRDIDNSWALNPERMGR